MHDCVGLELIISCTIKVVIYEPVVGIIKEQINKRKMWRSICFPSLWSEQKTLFGHNDTYNQQNVGHGWIYIYIYII